MYGVSGFLDDVLGVGEDVGRDVVVAEWRTTIRPYNPWLEHKGRFIGQKVGEGLKSALAFPVFSSPPQPPPRLSRKDKWVGSLVDPVSEPIERGIQKELEPVLKKALIPWAITLIAVGGIAGYWWRGRRSR